MPAGTLPERPAAVAQLIREAAAELEADETGILRPNVELSERLLTLDEVELVPMIELSLKDRVEAIIETYGN